MATNTASSSKSLPNSIKAIKISITGYTAASRLLPEDTVNTLDFLNARAPLGILSGSRSAAGIDDREE